MRDEDEVEEAIMDCCCSACIEPLCAVFGCFDPIKVGLTALFTWLFLRNSLPISSVQNFYVPALNKTLNSTTNTSIYFDIELHNPNWNEAIYYNTIYLNFYYLSNQSYFFVANQTFVGFHQGFKKRARRTGTLEVVGVPWGDVFRVVSNGSMPVFRVVLVTSFKFKVLMSWKSKELNQIFGYADVAVNGSSGEKDGQHGVRVNVDDLAVLSGMWGGVAGQPDKSGAPEIRCGPAWLLVVGSIVFYNLLFIT